MAIRAEGIPLCKLPPRNMHPDAHHTPLYIYNASAGAGKTYTLVRRFLLHTLCGPHWDDAPWLALQPLTRTLCITFTKKATGELKERIITTLHALSLGASPMLDDLAQDSELPTMEISRRATILLRSLLANYSLLAVSTIDSFVQRMGATLRWELEVPHEVATSLDLQEMLNAASEQMLAQLKCEEATYAWLCEMARDGVRRGQGWRFQQRLAQLGRTLFQPAYEQLRMSQRQAFFSIERIDRLRQRLRTTVEHVTEQAAAQLDSLEALRTACSISPDDFAYGANSHWAILRRVVEQIKNGHPYELKSRILSAARNPEAWFAKRGFPPSKRTELIHLVQQTLLPPFAQLAAYLEAQRAEYLTGVIALRHLPMLALLSGLRERITEMSRERQTLYLSDMGTLLRDLKQDEDASFIFERMGTRYDSVMIDEFQDTSTTQWALLEPLVNESLAQGGLSMLVGDVKQAIYRWRGGDWQLLAQRIPARFDSTFGCERIALERNYRSAPRVVAFNNHLFRTASAAMPGLWQPYAEALPQREDIQTQGQALLAAYQDMQTREYGHLDQQPVATTHEGYVEIALTPLPSEGENAGDEPATDPRIAYTVARIDYLIDELGVPPGQIAVLLRRRATATLLVNALIDHGQKRTARPYSVVSQDALQLDLSPDVQLMLSALRIAAHRATGIDFALIKRHVAEIQQQVDTLLCGGRIAPQKGKDEPYAAWLRQFNTYPLLEAFDSIAQGLCLPTDSHELPYVLKLRDIAHARQRDGGITLQTFLTWYEQQDPEMRTLELPSDDEAINVLTIHKSKGLEFDTVICPEVDWTINPQQGDLLWGKPCPTLPEDETLPTVASKQALGSSMGLTALEEVCLRHIDALNLLYVAFTRAKQRLIIVHTADTPTSGGTYASFVSLGVECPMEGAQHGEYADAQLHCWGQLASHASGDGKGEASAPILLTVPEGERVLYTETPLRIRRAVSSGDNATFQQMVDRRHQQAVGEALHDLLARLGGEDSLATELQRLETQGLLTPGMGRPLADSIAETLKREPLRTCFDANLTHWAERDLLNRRGKLFRPDRVTLLESATIVLDFKFGHPAPDHAKQVNAYMQWLRELGLPAPQGYLWYIDPHTATNRLESVPGE